MFDVFSTTARSSVTQAHQEARSRGNDYIGTEHLLLGVLAVDDDPVSTTLQAFNLTREAIRSRVEDSIGPEADPTPGHIPFSPAAKSALERSRYDAEVRGEHVVEPAHILAAVLAEDDSAAAHAVASLGAPPAAIRERALDHGPATGTGV
jgi:ATP-dependent Clp protease ATP-binding subunit ClpC